MRISRTRLGLLLAVLLVGAFAAAAVALASVGAGYDRRSLRKESVEPTGVADGSLALEHAKQAERAQQRERELSRRLARWAPRGLYLVVDTWDNRARLYRDGELLREMVSSTGSGTLLRDPVGGRTWIFETPHGERRVERKVRNPIWIKPDWAFIEEGFEPPKSAVHRLDDVSLGDYAIYLGDGYLIHGTLFQTLLGRRVTHGCIRLGDDDLAFLYKTLPVGSRVYLY